MLIQIEETPNPLSLKFIPEGVVSSEGVLDIDSPDQAATISPLAKALFEIEGVKKVFLAYDFISITLDKSYSWDHIKPQIVACISDFYSNGLPIINYDKLKADSSAEGAYKEGSIEAQINDFLEDRIRPAVAMDGGDVVFSKFENGKLYLKLLGACDGCPSAEITLKNGIENMIKFFIPEVEEVIQVESE